MKLKPEYAVMENVPEVMSPKYKQNLSTLLLQLAGSGYQLQCYVLSSWAFGAGSGRERFVLLATRLGTPLPPNLQPFHAKKTFISTTGACDGRLRRNERGPAQTAERTRIFLGVLR